MCPATAAEVSLQIWQSAIENSMCDTHWW